MRSSSIRIPEVEKLNVLQAIPYFLLSFLTSNATVLGSFSPFGISLCMAAPRSYAVFAAAGSALGYLVFGGVSQNASYLGAILLATVIRLMIRPKKRSDELYFLLRALLSFLILLSINLFYLFSYPSSIGTIALKVAESILCGCMTYMISLIFCTMEQHRFPSRLAEKASLAILCVLVLLSLAPIEVGNIQLVRVIGVIAISVGYYQRGYSGGMLVAVLFTISMTLYRTDASVSAGMLIIAAFVAGVFQPLGKVPQATMFIATCTFGAVILGTEEITTMNMIEIFLGTAAFFALPERLYQKLNQRGQGNISDLQMEGDFRNGLTSKLNFTANTLMELQKSIEEISERMEDIAGNDIFHVYTKAADQVCSKCGLNTFCWVTAYNDIMNSLNGMTKTLRVKGQIEKENTPFFFQQKCCQPEHYLKSVNYYYKEYLAREQAARRVNEARMVAIQQLEGISNMLCEMSSEFADMEQAEPQAGQIVEQIFLNYRYVPEQVSCYTDRYGRLYCEVYLPNAPKQVELAVICDVISKELEREMELPSIVSSDVNTKIAFFEKANFSVEFHSSQISNTNDKYCGDSFEYFTDSKGFAYLILSDGMGSGARAAVDSTMTCSIAKKLLQTGFGFDSTFQLVNLSFLVKSREESLATLDICTIDLYTGKAEFAKSGAATSFVLRGSQVTKVESSSLPIGILQGIKYDRDHMKLSSGDMVVLVSDGVLATGEDWICSELELYHNLSAKEISQKLCAEAQRRRIDGHSDDITVIAVKLKK